MRSEKEEVGRRRTRRCQKRSARRTSLIERCSLGSNSLARHRPPVTAACTGCHDDTDTLTHARLQSFIVSAIRIETSKRGGLAACKTSLDRLASTQASGSRNTQRSLSEGKNTVPTNRYGTAQVAPASPPIRCG